MVDKTSLAFTEIVDIEDPLLPAYLDAYETCFPANEREPVSKLVKTLIERKRGRATNTHLLVASEGASLRAMAKYSIFHDKAVAYLTYMAVVDPFLRGQGLGTRTFHEIVRRTTEERPRVAGLVLEIDDPAKYQEDKNEQTIALRRVRFYKRLGVRLLRGVDYTQTVEFFPEGTPMLLGVLPISAVTPEWVIDRCVDLFGDDVEKTGALALD